MRPAMPPANISFRPPNPLMPSLAQPGSSSTLRPPNPSMSSLAQPGSSSTIRLPNQQQIRPPISSHSVNVNNPAFNPMRTPFQSTPNLAYSSNADSNKNNISGRGTVNAKMMAGPALASNLQHQQKWSSMDGLSGGLSRPRPPPPAPKAAMAQCRAIYDYNAKEADEISIRAGDIITIISKGLLGRRLFITD
jgi:hypothetical protein